MSDPTPPRDALLRTLFPPYAYFVSFVQEFQLAMRIPVTTKFGTRTLGRALTEIGMTWVLCCRPRWIFRGAFAFVGIPFEAAPYAYWAAHTWEYIAPHFKQKAGQEGKSSPAAGKDEEREEAESAATSANAEGGKAEAEETKGRKDALGAQPYDLGVE